MSRRAAFKQADLTRALRAAIAAGMDPRGAKIDPSTGSIELQFGKGSASDGGNSFDQLRAAGSR